MIHLAIALHVGIGLFWFIAFHRLSNKRAYTAQELWQRRFALYKLERAKDLIELEKLKGVDQ